MKNTLIKLIEIAKKASLISWQDREAYIADNPNLCRALTKFAELLQANSGNAVDERVAFEAMAHNANEWADTACNAKVWIENIRDGISTPEQALANLKDCFEHNRQVSEAAQTASASLANKPDAQYRKLMAAFHVNMLRAHPEMSHDEITAAINKAITKG